MPSFLDRLFGKNDKSAKNIAKDRLRLVLMHDRADIPAAVMEEIRREFLLVLRKHLDIDEEALEVNLDCAEGDTVALVANIPIRRVLPRDGNGSNGRNGSNDRDGSA